MQLGQTFVGRLVAVGIVFGSLFASARAADVAGPAEPKSPAARQAKQEYDAAVAKIEADLATARKAYSDKLDAALKAAMAAGDLDEANRIDALRKAGVANAAKPAGAAATAPAGQKPGWIVGTIADARGKPIVGAQFEVAVFGTTLQGGQRAEFRMEVDENGHFEQELPDGLYACTAYIVKDFEGTRYRLQLHPNDDKHEKTKLASKPGIVKDFTWKMTGLRPGYDPKHAFSYYGPSMRLYDVRYLGEDNDKLLGKFGKDAKAVVTLTPRGTLIDGAKGEPVIITASLGEIGTTLGLQKFDVPLGAYTCSAKVVTAGGKEQPLRIGTAYGKEGAATVDVSFVQHSVYSSVEEIKLHVGE